MVPEEIDPRTPHQAQSQKWVPSGKVVVSEGGGIS